MSEPINYSFGGPIFPAKIAGSRRDTVFPYRGGSNPDSNGHLYKFGNLELDFFDRNNQLNIGVTGDSVRYVNSNNLVFEGAWFTADFTSQTLDDLAVLLTYYQKKWAS